MLKDSSIYLASVLVSTLLAFLTLPFFTQYLSVSDYGLIALFILFGGITSNFLSLGLQNASMRFYFKYEKKNFALLNSTIVVFIICIFFVAGFFLIFPFADWISQSIFNSEMSAELLKLSFISGCFHYFYIYFNHLLTVQKRAISASIINISHILINIIITIYLIKYQSLTYMAAIYALLIANVLMSIVSFSSNFLHLIPKFSFFNLKKSVIFAYAEVPSMLVGLLYGSFDKAMLTNTKGAASVGYYEFGSKFAIILSAFMGAISKSWIPFFMENAEKKERKFNQLIITRFYEFAILLAFIGLGISYFTEEALIILTTPEFHDAKYLTPIFVVYYLIGILPFLTVNQLMFAEKLIYNLPASILGLIINVSLNLVLIPKYGAFGAVIATAISAVIVSVCLFYFANKAHPLPINYKKLLLFFIIVILYTLMIYPVFYIDLSVVWKICIKILLILSFVFVSIRLRFISTNIIKSTLLTIIRVNVK